MSSTNFAGTQISIAGNAYMNGVFAGVGQAINVTPWPVKALWMANSALVGQGFGLIRGENMSPGAALMVGGTQLLVSLVASAAITASAGIVAPMVVVGVASFLAGEAALWVYDNNFFGFADAADAAAAFGQEIGAAALAGFQRALEYAGELGNDFGSAASELANEMLSGFRDYLSGLRDEWADLFGPGGPLGPGGPTGPLGPLFAPDGALFGPGGLFSPDGPFGPNGLFGPDGPLAPGWFDPDGPFFFPPISPLVFDFDGDGLDLIAIDQSTAFFDLNLNGLAEHTAWIGPDDGFLALDRNGDGVINDLTELFGGVEVDGFTRLTELDSNGDGVISQVDALFGQLLVWRDLDGDGITDQGETSSLAANGVLSISLADIFIDQWDGGNWISHSSTFQSVMGGGAIYDVWFENDQTHSLPTPTGGPASIPDHILTLPQIDATGSVFSLHAVMASDAALRDRMISLVENSADLTPRQLFAEIEAILLQWTGADDAVSGSRGQFIDARELAFLEAVHGTGFAPVAGTDPGRQAAAALSRYYDQIVTYMSGQIISQLSLSDWLRSGDFQAFLDHPLTVWAGVGWDGTPDELSSRFDEVFDYVIDRVASALTDSDVLAEAIDLVQVMAVVGATAGLSQDAVAERLLAVDGALLDPATRNMLAAFITSEVLTGEDEADVLGATAPVDTIIVGFAGDDQLSGANGHDTLWGGWGDDRLTGDDGSDIYIYNSGDGHDRIVEGNAYDGSIDRLVLGEGLTADLLQITRAGVDVVLTFTGHEGSIRLQNEDSTLRAGVEEVVFGDGLVWTRADLFRAYALQASTPGNDTINGTQVADILAGGLGNDTLSGGGASDTYVYNAGDGHDRIFEGNAYDGSVDRLVLGDGLTANLLQITREGVDVILTFTGHEGSIRLQNEDSTLRAGVEEIVFGNGLVWTRADLFTAYKHQASTPGNDFIYGTQVSDILTGGLGNDTLSGGSGSDTYVYNAGDGHDRVVEGNAYDGSIDRVVLGEGLTPDLLQVARDGVDIILSFIGLDGSIRLQSQDTVRAGVEQVVFGDGVVWNRQQLLAAASPQAGLSGAIAEGPLSDDQQMTAIVEYEDAFVLTRTEYQIAEREEQWLMDAMATWEIHDQPYRSTRSQAVEEWTIGYLTAASWSEDHPHSQTILLENWALI